MTIEQGVTAHYTHGALEAVILDALKAAGKDVERLAIDDLSGADEFHTGWRPATAELAKELGLGAGMRVLDVGSGLGGPARYFAAHHGCTVHGIDLTPEYVAVAGSLTRRCGLSEKVTFAVGNGCALPVAGSSFDRATLIHVGMNIADKAAVFAEVARALKPGGLFGVYDLMLTGPGEVPYPMPWAQSRATSFLEIAADLRVAARRRGLHRRAPARPA